MRLRVSKVRWKSYIINALELIEESKFTEIILEGREGRRARNLENRKLLVEKLRNYEQNPLPLSRPACCYGFVSSMKPTKISKRRQREKGEKAKGTSAKPSQPPFNDDETRICSAPPQRGTKRGPNKTEKDEESDGTGSRKALR
jgi:hypothetical protein